MRKEAFLSFSLLITLFLCISFVLAQDMNRDGIISGIVSILQSIFEPVLNFLSTLGGYRPLAAGPTTLNVIPQEIIDTSLTRRMKFTVEVTLNDIENLYYWEIKLSFDPEILKCTNLEYPPDEEFIFAGERL